MKKQTTPAPEALECRYPKKDRSIWKRLGFIVPAIFIYAIPLYHTVELTQISSALSTRYLDRFPKNIDHVTEFILESNDRLLIQTDIYAYGVFSHPHGWDRYRSAIEKKQSDIPIEIHCYSNSMTRTQLVRQFSFDTLVTYLSKVSGTTDTSKFAERLAQLHRAALDTMKTSSRLDMQGTSYRRRWEGFVRYFTIDLKGKFGNPDTLESIDDFIDFIVMYNQQSLDNLKEGQQKSNVTIRRIDSDISTFAWYRDDREAIFSMTSYRAGAQEFSFRTRDKDFILAVFGSDDPYALQNLSQKASP